MKRIIAALVCLLLVSASGCELFPVPTSAGTASAPPASASSGQSAEPAASPEASAAATVSPTEAPTEEPTEAPTEEPTEGATEEPTEEPTEAPTAEPTQAADSTEGMIFSNSDTELLMWDDLIALSANKLDLARNEIFARAGYTFTNAALKEYYGKLSWYKADPAFSENNFTDIQFANIHLIQAAEKAVKGQLFQIASGTKLDYDQDGDLETLTYSAPDDTHMNLKLKDGSTETPWNIECEQPINKVYLGDIDFKDGKLDLFVGEKGPSDDYSVYVTGVKHHAFLQRGKIPGTLESGSDKNPFKPNGKGQITTLGRIDVVGTDFFAVRYKLNSSGKLASYPLASYNFISFSPNQYKLKTKVELKLKKTDSATSAVAFTVAAGTEVQLLSTDAKKWIKVKAPAGTAWLELEAPLKLADPNISTWDAFEGLVMAD